MHQPLVPHLKPRIGIHLQEHTVVLKSIVEEESVVRFVPKHHVLHPWSGLHSESEVLASVYEIEPFNDDVIGCCDAVAIIQQRTDL